MYILVFALIMLVTAIASAIHGSQLDERHTKREWYRKLPKASYMAAHILLVALISLLVMKPVMGLLFGALSGTCYWCMLRRSTQARAELNAMDRYANPKIDYASVVIPYLIPVGIASILFMLSSVIGGAYIYSLFGLAIFSTVLTPALAIRLFNYESRLGRKLGWNHGGFWDCRRGTEILVGLAPGGAATAALVTAFAFIIQ